MSRWIGFLFVILVGVALGLLYGWVVDPVEFIDTTPDSLREDYRADYVLMVAEIYQADRDSAAAVTRLTFLANEEPLAAIQNAARFATEVSYATSDLAKIDALFDAVMAWYDNPLGDTAP